VAGERLMAWEVFQGRRGIKGRYSEPVSLKLDPELKEALVADAERHGRTLAQTIRYACRRYIEARRLLDERDAGR
jgi:hypothetical protein